MTTTPMTSERPVTGWTVLAWISAFFAVVFVANGIFIYYAVGTFPGLEVASSYKAGQEFTGEVAAARAQAERAWTVDVTTGLGDEGATVRVSFRSREGNPQTGLLVVAELEHPTLTSADRRVVLKETEPGHYEGTAAGNDLGGRRMLVLTASRDGERLFMSRNALLLAR